MRIVEKDNGTVTSDRRLLWCDNSICEERDGTGSANIKRFFDDGVEQGGASYFYASDHLGSTREMTDSTGVIRARHDYDPWGRRAKIAGDLDADFGFTGHYLHGQSGLYLAPFRAYSADLGRWISEDPISAASFDPLRGVFDGAFDFDDLDIWEDDDVYELSWPYQLGILTPDGLNLNSYVRNNPIARIDPTGQWAWIPRALAGAWAAARVAWRGGRVHYLHLGCSSRSKREPSVRG